MRTVLALACFLPLLLNADQIALKNGDRVTGTILNSDDKTLTMKTEAMGEVMIQRSSVIAITSDQPLTVTLKGGEKVVGTLSTEAGQVTVHKPDQTAVTSPLADIGAIRPDGAQKAWEREQTRLGHPPLTDFWSGNISLNLANASGNARTTTLGTGATAQRETGKDKIVLNYAQIYSTQHTTEPFGATANRISGGLRYDRNIAARLFGFVLNSYDYDRFQNLDLRSVVGGGLGYHAYKSSRSYWDLGLGADWNREAFSTGLVRNSGEALVSEESSHQLTALIQMFQRLTFFPNLTNTGQYRVNFDGGSAIKLTKLLSWNITLSDRYLSDPLPGKKKNDLVLTTGIGISFQQK